MLLLLICIPNVTKLYYEHVAYKLIQNTYTVTNNVLHYYTIYIIHCV